VGKVHHPGWDQKQLLRAETKRVRDMEAQRQQELEDARAALRDRRMAKRRRDEINERRAEQTQTLNPKRLRQKLKTMSKKQKRQVRRSTVLPHDYSKPMDEN
jgi:hypothetical protein